MDTTKNMTLKPTTHALKQIVAKGFDADGILDCWNNPTRVYPSKSHPGQFRVINGTYCLVGKPEGSSFMLITVYLDGVVTPPREDQMDTKQGRAFASRYAATGGRLNAHRAA